MEKTSKIVEIQENVGSFDTKYGKMYNHAIAFENGDKGNYGSKMAACKYKVGETIPYNIEPNGNYPAKIKPIAATANEVGGYKPKADDPEKQLMIVRQSCIGYAVNLYAALPESDKITLKKPSDAVKALASEFVKYVINGTKVQEINK